jgi:apolipoprotein N-acyltransferase
MLVNYSLALGAFAVLDWRGWLDAESTVEPRLASRWMIAAGLASIGWIAFSIALDRPMTMPRVRVAALHYDAGRPRGQGGEKFIAQTRQAVRSGAQFVVWPELAIDYDPQMTNTNTFRALAKETNAYLTIGYIVRTSPTLHRNEATVLSPQGEFLGIYGKEHPTLMMGETNTTLGTHPVYATPLGRLATIICYDLDFTDTARAMARNGAQIIAVPSLDDPTMATKHYTHLIFRAIENRVPMIKSDSTGSDSVIVDAYGRVLAKAITPQNDAVLVADVSLGTGDALVVTLGDWVGWLCLAGLVFFICFVPLTLRRGSSKHRVRSCPRSESLRQEIADVLRAQE